MKCAVHSDVDAVGYCRNCGKPMCSACVRPVRDVLYCEDCLATIMGVPGASAAAGSSSAIPAPAASTAVPQLQPAATALRPRSPILAFVLGFVFPGLAAVYNGEYNKALIQIVVFATFIFGLSSDLDGGMKAVLGILLAGFIFYQAFDGMRTAEAQNRGQASADPLESWSKDRPIGPIILIVVGALFLLNNFDWFPFYRIERFWPLILIAVGVLMFRNRLGRRS
jgi:TM2 domain-containing membrane protein YozV